MCLLDALIACDGTDGTAVADLRRVEHFADETGRVPSYVGVEFMAQTVGAMAGLTRWQQGLTPLIGLLLGTRRCQIKRSHFPIEGEVTINMRAVLLEQELAVFDGIVEVAGEEYAVGSIKAIQPANEGALLQIMNSSGAKAYA